MSLAKVAHNLVHGAKMVDGEESVLTLANLEPARQTGVERCVEVEVCVIDRTTEKEYAHEWRNGDLCER